MCSTRSLRPLTLSSARRIEKMQGTLMKCVGELERCKDYMALHYDPGVVYGNEDYDYWVRAARQGVIIRNLPDVVLKYRMKDRTKLGGVFYERNAQRNVKFERGIRERAQGLVSRNFNQILRSF